MTGYIGSAKQASGTYATQPGGVLCGVTGWLVGMGNTYHTGDKMRKHLMPWEQPLINQTDIEKVMPEGADWPTIQANILADTRRIVKEENQAREVKQRVIEAIIEATKQVYGEPEYLRHMDPLRDVVKEHYSKRYDISPRESYAFRERTP